MYITDEEEPEETDDYDSGNTVVKVTCGAVAGTLHVNRFASGICLELISTISLLICIPW